MLGRGGHFDNESAFVVEGAYTVVAELKLSERFNEDLPIAYGVYSMIYEKKDPVAIIEDLMKRPLKGEWNFSFFSPT
jgi:glycerol-3-phosphate dehydrogenase (NAD(P)+)